MVDYKFSGIDKWNVELKIREGWFIDRVDKGVR